MSPASAVNELQQDLQLQTLARSFEALLLTIQHLGCKERDLHRRLEYAHDEVNYIPHLHSCCQIPPSPVVSNDEKISSRSGVASAAVTDKVMYYLMRL